MLCYVRTVMCATNPCDTLRVCSATRVVNMYLLEVSSDSLRYYKVIDWRRVACCVLLPSPCRRAAAPPRRDLNSVVCHT